MSELSGTAAVGIETVEWLDGGSGNLVVRVTGRWRRRRPASTAQVTLVIESDGRRHRFPAMPDPPSLDGTGPGMWRLSFSVPGSLAPALGGHIWLALGTVTVPLPAPGAGENGAVPTPTGEPVPVETPPVSEPPPADRLHELEVHLADIRSERDQLVASLAEGERTRRIAEQRAHAEQALRHDLGHRMASLERETEHAREAMGELAAAEERIRALERQLRESRRRGDEAEQQAAAAVARARARRAQRPVTSVEPDLETARLRLEGRLRDRLAGTHGRVPAEPAGPPAPPTEPHLAAPEVDGGAPEPAPGRPETSGRPDPTAAHASPTRPEPAAIPMSALVDTLRRELDARAAGDAALRARLVAAETRLAARVLLDQRTTETLRQLRAELDGLQVALTQERARRPAAERRVAGLEAERRAPAAAERRLGELELAARDQRQRSRDAYDAIGQLRGTLERLATAPAPEEPPVAESSVVEYAEPPVVEFPVAESPAPRGAGPVQVDRLSDALARLRESVVAADDAPGSPAVSPTAGGRTLRSAFRRLVRQDADAAGELLLDLLVLQRAAYPHPIAYDLVLGPGQGCVRVTVADGPPSIERHGAARTREEVDFRVRGQPPRIARLLTAHGIWRRFGPRVARVRGSRQGLAALDALLTLPLDLAALREAGATLRPEASFGLVAGMVDPAWTAGERFVIAHRDPDGATVYLSVRDGRGLEVLRTPPAGRIATTIVGPADVLVTVLSGGASPAGHVTGDAGPIESLRTWIKHAQSV